MSSDGTDDADGLAGRVCIVGGGGRGLGAATARDLADRGARVVVNDLGTSVRGEGADDAVAREVATEIRDAGGAAVAHAGDLTDFGAARDLVATAVDAYGRLDAVANFAGILRDGYLTDLPAADWYAVLETNLTGQFALLQAASAHWRSAGTDHHSYLAASSMAARGNVGQVNYAAAKAGVLGMVRAASSELFDSGIRVNALVPNAYTRMTETVPAEHRPYTPEEMPPERVATVAAYLLGEAASDVTGCAVYAGGDRVGVLSDPSLEVVGVNPGGWSVDALAAHFREDLAEAVDLTRTDSYV